MILAAAFVEAIPIIVCLLIIFFLFITKRKYFFKMLAKINKILFPSLYKKDIALLRNYEKVMLSYRLWVTKNSL